MAITPASSTGRTISAALARTDARLVLGLLLAGVAITVNVALWRGGESSQALVVAAHEIPAGAVLARDDLTVGHARLQGPLAAMAIPGAQIERAIGETALQTIHAGALVTAPDLGPGPVLHAGEAAVTVPVDPAAVYPRLARGDVVAIVGTSARQTPQSQTVTVLPQAVVYDIGVQPTGFGGTSAAGAPDGRLLNVTLIVPSVDAEAVAHAVVDWQVTLVLLPRRDGAEASPVQR